MVNSYELVRGLVCIHCEHKGRRVLVKISMESLEIVERATKVWVTKSKSGKLSARARVEGKDTLIHRLVYPGPISSKDLLGFRDGDTLNCTVDNLYITTTSEVFRRAKLEKNHHHLSRGNLSEFIGISDLHGKYRVRISKNDGSSEYIGSYDTLAEAIQARKVAEAIHWRDV